MGHIIAKASKESLDRLVRSCMQSQKKYLEQLFDFCTDTGDYLPYNQVTGEEIKPEEPAEEDIMQDLTEPALTPGNYVIKFDLPNFTGLTADNLQEIDALVEGLQEDKREEVRQSYQADPDQVSKAIDSTLKTIVTNQIVKKELMQDRDNFRRYFSTLLVPSPDLSALDGGMAYEELDTLRLSAMDAVEPLVERLSSSIISALQTRLPGFESGARVRLECSIDQEGRLQVNSTERLYLDDETVHIFSIPVHQLPDDTEERDAYLNRILTEFTYNKIISENLRITQHPEHETLFLKDQLGNVTGPTLQGEHIFEAQAKRIVQNLKDKIDAMPLIDAGGLVSVKTQVMDNELSDALVEYVILDPEKEMEIRDVLPPVNTDDVLEKGDIYEDAARRHAIDVMVANMRDHPHFDRYFEKVPGDASLLDDKEPEYRFTEDGEIELERIYDKITDRITEAMLELDDSRAVPFYIKIGFDNPADEQGVQEPEILDVKKTIFNYGKAGFPQIVITSPRTPELKLTNEVLRRDAADIFDKVVSHVIRPHMKSQGHPDYERCFIEDPENPGKAWITEEGVELLEDTINNLTSHVAREVLQQRTLTPEHFHGMRTIIDYGVGRNDKLNALRGHVQYFVPVNIQKPNQNGRITFNLADVSHQLDNDVIPEEREEKLKQYIVRTAKNMIIQLAAQNMYGTEHIQGQPAMYARPKHPAFDSFFVMDQERKELVMTTLANQVLGQTIRKYAQKVARQLDSIPGLEKGGKFVLEYNFGPTELRYASVMKLGGGQGPEHKKLLKQIVG